MRPDYLFSQIYFKSTGYSFTHLGRMFLRIFVGIMIVQFGLRQLLNPSSFVLPDTIPFLETGLATWLVIIVEVISSFCIMIGLFTRAMIIPPFILMIVASYHICGQYALVGIFPVQQLCLTFLFMGIFLFLMLVGPGKISVDYFFSLYLINRLHKGKEEDLEEI